MRGYRERLAGRTRPGDRRQALFVALCVLLAIALVTAGLVLAQNISGGPGYEVLSGTPGDDVINARDGGPDTIDCGAGNDTVYVDRSEEGVYDCETVIAP